MSSSTRRAAASGPCTMGAGSSMASLGTLTSPPPLTLVVRVCREQ